MNLACYERAAKDLGIGPTSLRPVVFAHDEMKISEGLVFDPRTGLLVGWSDCTAHADAAWLAGGDGTADAAGARGAEEEPQLATYALQTFATVLPTEPGQEPVRCEHMATQKGTELAWQRSILLSGWQL